MHPASTPACHGSSLRCSAKAPAPQECVWQVPHSISKDSAVPLTQHAANAARMHTPGAEQLHVNGSWRLRAGAPTVRGCSDAGLSREALWHNMLCTVLVPGDELAECHR